MKIEIVVDPVNLPSQSLASRVAPAPATDTNGTIDAPRYGEDPLSRSRDLTVSFSRGGPRRGRGRGPRRRNERPNKTAADLDAEMEVTKLRFPITFSHVHASR
jgi:hypothetical protein